ncbi:MAG: anti-sigma factor family protein [Thermomicrobiales bacterium]
MTMTMTCQECVDKLQPYLDRSLTDAERSEVDRHLTVCGHCADSFHFEAGILRVVGRCGRSTAASEEFKARIRVVVQTAIVERE